MKSQIKKKVAPPKKATASQKLIVKKSAALPPVSHVGQLGRNFSGIDPKDIKFPARKGWKKGELVAASYKKATKKVVAATKSPEKVKVTREDILKFSAIFGLFFVGLLARSAQEEGKKTPPVKKSTKKPAPVAKKK